MVVCFVAIFVTELIPQKQEADYDELIFFHFIILTASRMALMASAYFLGLFACLQSIFMSQLSKGICFGFGIAVFVPVYFGIVIEESDTEGMFIWKLNEFGSSKYFIIYL